MYTGTGMDYMPGAASLAATHRGKIKNIRLSTLRDASQNLDQRSCILDFEKEAIAHDKKQKLFSEGTICSIGRYCNMIFIFNHCLRFTSNTEFTSSIL